MEINIVYSRTFKGNNRFYLKNLYENDVKVVVSFILQVDELV